MTMTNICEGKCEMFVSRIQDGLKRFSSLLIKLIRIT